jgi:arylsulfatase A-like enzyme
MGWVDSGIYGSTYFETPNVDRFASQGMMFTDAHSANPLCSPTRASIMTGKNPDRLGITVPWCHEPPVEASIPGSGPSWQKMLTPRPRTYLPHSEYTLAQAMKDGGYQTGFIGKWHLGHQPYYPENHGFDFNIAGCELWGPPSYFSPYRNPRLEDGPDGEHITDRLTTEAIDYIHSNKDRPFFLCLWTYAVHSPYQAKPALVKKYRGKKDPRGLQASEVMGGMIECMDTNFGRLLDAIDKEGIAGNTVVIFNSDNGPSKGVVDGVPVSTAYPLRGMKGHLYEGGTRVPLIIRWPGVVEPGSSCREVVTSTDMYPTVLEMAGIEPRKEQARDGVSLLPLVEQTGKLDRDTIFCHLPQGDAFSGPNSQNSNHVSGTYVRKGPWKLIRRYDSNIHFPNRYELFNLDDDIGETTNLAFEHPDKVRKLLSLMEDYLEDTEALLPILNPAFEPGTRRWVGIDNNASNELFS